MGHGQDSGLHSECDGPLAGSGARGPRPSPLSARFALCVSGFFTRHLRRGSSVLLCRSSSLLVLAARSPLRSPPPHVHSPVDGPPG